MQVLNTRISGEKRGRWYLHFRDKAWVRKVTFIPAPSAVRFHAESLPKGTDGVIVIDFVDSDLIQEVSGLCRDALRGVFTGKVDSRGKPYEFHSDYGRLITESVSFKNFNHNILS